MFSYIPQYLCHNKQHSVAFLKTSHQNHCDKVMFDICEPTFEFLIARQSPSFPLAFSTVSQSPSLSTFLELCCSTFCFYLNIHVCYRAHPVIFHWLKCHPEWVELQRKRVNISYPTSLCNVIWIWGSFLHNLLIKDSCCYCISCYSICCCILPGRLYDSN